VTGARAPLSVVVLAGGRARRLGGRKADLVVGGRSLLGRVLDAARSLSDDVLLLPGDRDVLATDGVRVVPEGVAGRGPLAALGAGLAAARHEWSLLLPCDAPQPSAAVARALLRRARSSLRPAVVVRDGDGRLQPFHGLYHRLLAPEVDAHLSAGGRSLLGFLDAWGPEVVPAAELTALDAGRRFLIDVNTPADLARARAEVTA